MAKYAVFYQGYAYVEANSPEEAEAAYQDGDVIYDEEEATDILEINEFAVRIPSRCADGERTA